MIIAECSRGVVEIAGYLGPGGEAGLTTTTSRDVWKFSSIIIWVEERLHAGRDPLDALRGFGMPDLVPRLELLMYWDTESHCLNGEILS